MILDGIEVKVGDRLWSLCIGWVIVANVNADGTILAKPSYPTTEWCWTVDGKKFHNTKEALRDIYWDEVKITPPPKPKRKVKKVIEKWMNLNDGILSSVWSTEESARENLRLGHIMVKLTGEYEVEE